MSMTFKITALVLLLCVAVVFISPVLDLDPTATRAVQAALATMLALAALLICSFSVPSRVNWTLQRAETARRYQI
ncbi:MAG: hypothetical protein ACRD3Q_06225, partial [Terriglobales bacterium]